MNEQIVAEELSRVIGCIEGSEPGPKVIALGGMHGNEPAGVIALQQVIENLKPKSRHFKGAFLALRGNIQALQQGVRYIDEDMNRIWFPSIIEKIRRTSEENLESSERREIKSLLRILDDFMGDDSSQLTIFADLHSFSAHGSMFAITAPHKDHINLFAKLQRTTLFLALKKRCCGAALSYYQDQGHVTFALEGGQHQAGVTVQNNAAALLAMLDEIGCLDTTDLPAFEQHEAYLADENKRLPAKVELVYQHMIENGDAFEMRPGYKNFQRVTEGRMVSYRSQWQKFRAQYDGLLANAIVSGTG